MFVEGGVTHVNMVHTSMARVDTLQCSIVRFKKKKNLNILAPTRTMIIYMPVNFRYIKFGTVNLAFIDACVCCPAGGSRMFTRYTIFFHNILYTSSVFKSFGSC